MDISCVVSNGMCVGCGTCAGICALGAIDMKYKKDGSLVAEIDNEKCVNCGQCLKVCPSFPERDIGATMSDIFYRNPEKEAYIAYAIDDEIRECGQSGGVVTALLLYLLESEKIRGLAACKYNPKTSMFETSIVKNKQELLDSAGRFPFPFAAASRFAWSTQS